MNSVFIFRVLWLGLVICLSQSLVYGESYLHALTNDAHVSKRDQKADNGLFFLRYDDGQLSCKDKCDAVGRDSARPCQCNKDCVGFGDCCPDYGEECLSCVGRCHFSYDKQLPCQCNKNCHKYKNCCEDNAQVCWGGEPPLPEANVTDAELGRLTEELWRLEGPNNCANLIRVNLQGRTSYGAPSDQASQPLLTVEAAAYRKPTVAKLLPLYDNYVPAVGTTEVVTPTETTEETQFLDEILATPIMQKLEDFLIQKNLIQTRKRIQGRLQQNPGAFREALHQIWFEMYSREGGIVGSSGFEHVFLGEVKNRQVQGLHNWVFFSKEESRNNVNYFGHLRNFRLGPKGSIIKHNFKWVGTPKPVSTMFIGTSPELEMALYTLCYYARPGSKCSVSLNDRRLNIQTHFINRSQKKYVASAYPDI